MAIEPVVAIGLTGRQISAMNNYPTQSRHHLYHQQQQQHHHPSQSHPQQLSLSQASQFRNRTGSISSTSSDNSGYNLGASSMSLGSPSGSSSSSSSVISGGVSSMPSSPVADYHRKQFDRSVSESVVSEMVISKKDTGTASSTSNRQQQQDLNNKVNQNNINSSRYKTELCRPFEENGYCKYGDKCQFAHGAHELRSLNRHPKYKTELCRTYHTIGFCPYGPRCHFIHNDDERRLAQQQALKQPPPPPPPPARHNPTTQPSPSSSHAIPAFSTATTTHSSAPAVTLPPPPLPRQPAVTAAPQQHSTLQHLRPKSLNFNHMTSLRRDNLGSTADSPPSSVSDSPTMSPTFLG